ncbi:insulinase family protein [Clostridium swellfunianum]|uniref:M16 family metallopeptidase n=1 Tax=Clostridium swellfunianum TaxID=1367462 RepID=UPI00202EF74A|nr:pitrilysin family protein [Clostridium swellfunianum]MCM0650493.1 insulinase family protein [Clostridium swellfunianum]
MIKHIFNNKLKLIYEYRPGNLTSFCIGFEAGALMENGYKAGTAHAVEHMLFKGTKTRNEFEINKLSDELFGFNNAMTNYPYCIYYGTTLSEDFYKGVELYSDIILNPSFPFEGFKEEISVISEELKEWKDDIIQYCEDELLHNSFKKRRIKDLIIGTEESVKAITLEEITQFYNEFYSPENCVISVVSSLRLEEVLELVGNNFGSWNKKYTKKNLNLYEENISETFKTYRKGINGAKLQYIYPIHDLNREELKVLTLFNLSFGEGTSSLLYDEVRTKRGLVYDISSTVKYEKGIKLFSINLGTSYENIDKATVLIDNIISRVKKEKNYFNANRISNMSRIIKLKRELKLERAIVLCKELATYELMFGDANVFYNEIENLDKITEEQILSTVNKVLTNPSIQIITPDL